MRSSCSVRLHSSAFLGLGLALAAVGGARWFPRTARLHGVEVAVWATDRGGNRLVGLDRELFVVREITVRAPVEVEPAPGGGAWVLSAVEGDPLGAHRLIRIAPDGEALAEASFGVAVDLASHEGREVVVVEWGLDSGAPDRAVLVDEHGVATTIVELPGVTCAAARDGVVLLGGIGGEVWLHELRSGSKPLAHAALGGEITDVAPGPRRGTWWALDAAGEGRLLFLEGDLRTGWQVTTHMQAIHLVPVPGREAVWLADTTEPFARRYGAAGTIEIERADLPLAGLDRGVAFADGAVLLAAPGAVLHLDAQGADAPGQGGFAFLVDLAWTR
ncbi:MAG: hypothetical protein E2O39_09340 [Planctomycetota bacterium]|nr:MAG: hypothetical protein E2O39_09340 [Planctomycetota bacterium]